MRFVASGKNVLERVGEKLRKIGVSVDSNDKVWFAGAEDRAMLESDLSAEAGENTDGQGEMLSPLFYSLTQFGQSVLSVITALGKWGDDHQENIYAR